MYNDGDIETIELLNETWRYASSAKLLSIDALSVHLDSEVPRVLDEMLAYFGNRPFLRHQAQAFPNYVPINAYNDEETEFKKAVKLTDLSDVPKDANIIASQTVYNIKTNDDCTLKLKARIAPHGNADCSRLAPSSDCSM